MNRKITESEDIQTLLCYLSDLECKQDELSSAEQLFLQKFERELIYHTKSSYHKYQKFCVIYESYLGKIPKL